MILSKADFMPLISTFQLNEIHDDEWKNIATYKYTYLVEDEPPLNRLLFPGFVFSSEEAARFYSDNILSFIKDDLKAFTTPRGNLSKSNNIVFIGQRPGTFTAHLSKAESSWLLGPSSKMLIKLCKDLKIYPYFTNFYHSHSSMIDKNSDNIFKELTGIVDMYTNLYNVRSFRFVFLGAYDEYNDLKRRLADDAHKDVSYFYIHAWHPAYLVRSYTNEKYYSWIKKLGNKLEDWK